MSHSFLVSYACYRCLLSCYPIRWYLFTVTTSYSIQTIQAFFSKLKTVLPFFSNALHFYQLDLFLIMFFQAVTLLFNLKDIFCVHTLFAHHSFIMCSMCVHGASTVRHSQFLILFSALHSLTPLTKRSALAFTRCIKCSVNVFLLQVRQLIN